MEKRNCNLQVCDLPLDRVLQNKDKENLLQQLIENATKSIGNLIHHRNPHQCPAGTRTRPATRYFF